MTRWRTDLQIDPRGPIEISDLLVELQPQQLRALAGFAHRVARYATERAEAGDRSRESGRAAEAAIAGFRKIPDLITRHMAAGLAEPAAIRAAAAEAKVPTETAGFYWRDAARKNRPRRTLARMVAIGRRIAQGRQQAAIAAELGVSDPDC